MPYEYQPLNNKTGEIRLLSIPVGVGDSEPFRCSLEHCARRCKPQGLGSDSSSSHEHGDATWGDFAALSYEWGPPLPRKTIILNDEPFEVVPNLFGALKSIRRAARAERVEEVRLWVGAICIDQSRVEEKNIQVPRMRHIYGSAPIVYCYPTPYVPPAVESSMPLQHLPLIGNVVKLLSTISRSWKPAYNYDHDMEAAGNLIAWMGHIPDSERRLFYSMLERNWNYIPPASWRAVMRLFGSSYWLRLWIIQEIAMAKNRIFILAGYYTLDFELVESAAITMARGIHVISRCLSQAFEHRPGELEKLDSTGFVHISNVSRLRHDIASRDQTVLDHDADLHALWLSNRTTCTDPRDRIYGILGLISPALANNVSVSYEKTPEQVYLDFVVSSLQCNNSLNILAQAGNTRELPNELPSWVPDLRKHHAPRDLPKVSPRGFTSVLKRPVICADSRLFASGICLDTIETLSLGIATGQPQSMIQPDVPTVSDHAYGNVDGLKIAFWHMLLCLPQTETFHPPLPTKEVLENISVFSTIAQIVARLLELNKDFMIAGHSVESLLADPFTNEGEFPSSMKGQWHDFFAQIFELIQHRRMALTRHGKLGLVPINSRPGDAIFALGGLDWPAVLNQVDGQWRFVGICYLHECGEDESSQHREVEEIEIV